jgi:hypothetical protein
MSGGTASPLSFFSSSNDFLTPRLSNPITSLLPPFGIFCPAGRWFQPTSYLLPFRAVLRATVRGTRTAISLAKRLYPASMPPPSSLPQLRRCLQRALCLYGPTIAIPHHSPHLDICTSLGQVGPHPSTPCHYGLRTFALQRYYNRG